MNDEIRPGREVREQRGALEEPPSFRLTPQFLLGLLVVGFGLLLTGDNLTWWDADRLLVYWPLGIVAVGVTKLVQARGGSGRLAGTLITGLGGLLFAEHTLRLNVRVEDWWPLALVALGFLILTRAVGGLKAAATNEATVSEFAFWSGKVRRVTSPAFRSADLTAVMGGVELDLRGATAAPGGAVIDVFVMWGGIEIWVPPDWTVSNEVLVLMGGAEDRSAGSQDSRSRLTVRGFCVMGGLEISVKS